LTADQALREAIAHHQAGRLEEAGHLYRAILQALPNHPDANHNFGMLAVQTMQTGIGLRHLKAALDANPNNDQYWMSYIKALIQAGQTDAARQVLEQGWQRGLQGDGVAELAGRLEPGVQEINTLVTLFTDGRYTEAASLAQTLTLRFPGHGFSWKVLGAAWKQMGRSADALAPMQKAAAVSPNEAESHNNLGATLRDLGQVAEAEASFRQALQLSPYFAEAHNNLGNSLRNLSRLSDAIVSYRRALELKPDYAEAHNNQGITLQELGRPDKADGSCRRALAIKPDYAEASMNLGHALRSLGRLDEAVRSYRRALEIRPNYAVAHNNLGITLQDLGQLAEAEASFLRSLEIDPNFSKAHSNLLLSLQYGESCRRAELFAEHLAYARRYEAPLKRRWLQHNNSVEPSRRLRVGYVSPDFWNHAVASFFEPILRQHDRQVVDVYCYAEVARPDDVTARLKGFADHWIDTVGMSDEVLARRIADDKIDILVDLAGHTAKNRLLVFARKPAPVQVTWLGYPHSTGLEAMDYRLVDAVTDPAGEGQCWASETLVRLDNGFLCYAPPPDAPPNAAPPCLASGTITFGSFNNPTKLSSATLDAWAMLLGRVPGSRLLAKGKLFADAGGRTDMLVKLQQRGVDAQRVTLLGPVFSVGDHLGLYEQVDIALDPFPYNGTTTTCEALWMGVPVVTLCGDCHAGRVGASLLTQIGLTELIAGSTEAYVEIAAGLATDTYRLSELRDSLRARLAASPLCNAPAFARKIESAYRDMWRNYCGKANDSTTTLDLVGGVRIVVPNSLELITPYILQEQQDWFEDEIKFLRHLLQPGNRVIDIGANYGVYTLSMAQTVGPTGYVWAFEPASETARLLAKGIIGNRFEHVVLERSALSNACGTGQLSLDKNSELNALAHDKPSSGPSETVPLVTLDKCMEHYGWQGIDFVKIDAEGEESNILEGGGRFFAELSPLVQYEIKADTDLHMELVERFAALGYDSYRLVPGLKLLVPFDAKSAPDAYLLNLFCCKPDRAESLAARGLLSDSGTHLTAGLTAHFEDIWKKVGSRDVYDWRNTVAKLAYGAQLANLWEQTMLAGNSAAVDEALSLYALSRDPSVSATERFSALAASLSVLRNLCESHPSHLRLASLARVAQDFGARSLAVTALRQLGKTIVRDTEVDPCEPFLAPGERFDSVPPGAAIGNWILAAVLEELERLGSFSSFYTKDAGRERLETIHALGFGSDQMERRLLLLQQRFGLHVP